MKKAFWKSDWFFGSVIALVFLFLAGSPLVERLDRDAYDVGVRASASDPGAGIAIIAIDDQSIENIGRWPWSRSVLAAMIDRLVEAQAKVIVPTVFLSEAQVDAGLGQVREIAAFVRGSALAGPEAESLKEKLLAAEAALDTDSRLAASIAKAGNVILPMQFVAGDPLGNPDRELSAPLVANQLTQVDDRVGAAEGDLLAVPTRALTPPIEALAAASAGIGSLLHIPDGDGGRRSVPLVVRYYDKYFPSQALLAAARSLNLGPGDVRVHLGEGVELGRLTVATDEFLRLKTFFYADQNGRPAFPVDSFYDVQAGKVPVEKYKGRIVLIGATAFGVGSPSPTPIAESMEPVVTMAHEIASILNEDFFVAPAWGVWVWLLVFLLVAAYLALVLPRLAAGPAFLVTAGMVVALVVLQLALMTTQRTVLELMGPTALLFVGYLLTTVRRFLLTERGKLRADSAAADSNRMLAIQFQQQKQLDMAFEKFRACPLDESLMEPLYSLAIDFESKRQPAKANAVYQYMASFDAGFRDIKERMAKNNMLQDTIIIGGKVGGPGATIVTDGNTKPMLGRYQVEKELGKGAMGIVYLGRDPKINRVVAIKTMALSQEFEADELEEVKTRFFREAETAGRLTHPNIVTIYDAGEEHDLAYIAMEFLQGHDLARYTKEDNLLPVPVVMGIIFKAAQALHYAHQNSVVHRDIKPANIMYEPESKKVKLTDFGIARITDSSKTKTGMVLGTPSYMSPEQLSGKKVDGRSDLFSLGVMLYQLVTGRLPFKGESMATLMYKIANEPHEDIFKIRPELATTRPCLAAIIDRALQKDVEKRYQNGEDMARDIQECAKRAG